MIRIRFVYLDDKLEVLEVLEAHMLGYSALSCDIESLLVYSRYTNNSI